jgi:GH25 family lysozyme M1 (1,4-beta-N-acetylmuramidase)
LLKKKFGVLLLAVSVLVSLIVPVHGADIGVKSPYKGIDVSKYQGTIDWAKVKQAGVRFAMIRTGYGGDGSTSDWNDQTDSCFVQNYNGATKNGIKVGAYHYSYATTVAMASQEADECLHILNGRPLDYPVAYDVEDSCQDGLSSELLGQIVQTFCEKVKQAGYKVMVYSCVNFYNNHLTSSLVSQYDTWIAHYTDDPTPRFSDYTMWQYSSSGSVNGITEKVDLDYSYYDYSIPAGTFRNDTSAYSFGTNSQYTYKIITDSTNTPVASSSNSSAISVSGATKVPDGFLFTITKKKNDKATITTKSSDGKKTASFNVSPVFQCDTGSYTFQSSAQQYVYKIRSSDSTPPTAKSSNPSVVSVSGPKKISDGYLFTIYNKGKGTASITTTASNGASISFRATGTYPLAIRSDTPLHFTLKQGTYYQYKFTGAPGFQYNFVSANNAVFRKASVYQSGGSYYFKIYGVAPGCAGLYASTSGWAGRVGIVTVSAPKPVSKEVRSDTPYYFNMKKGTYYQYKFTGAPGVQYSFACANNAVFRKASVYQSGGSYYFKIYAAGKGCAGLYASAPGWGKRVGIVTVS